jgi:ATP-dependent Lhr-like helicase
VAGTSFHAPVREWFAATFGAPTPVQRDGWPPIREGRSTLLLAPTGSGKTLAAFLAGLDRLMFEPPGTPGVRLLYVSPLKALAVDVERNLRTPLGGVAAQAVRRGVACRTPTVAIRTGDTPAAERGRQRRRPPEVLITTPESLYLILTSQAAATLRTVATVIVDEVHALLPTKRGAHLALSLERLEALRPRDAAPLQRLGLSATQRPPAEAARFLGGVDPQTGAPRPVTIVDARRPKTLELRVELPGHADPAAPRDGADAAPATPPAASAWPAIHARLLELVRAHRTTMIFVNSRRLAERLAGALNALAGAEVAQAHHGSVAREQRQAIEGRLKAGALPAIVATSSLELGIDMGAVDLCVQIEAPLSVTSGLQRIGRAGHQVDAPSRGVLLPKFRGDLLCSAAAARLMLEQAVEATAYPRCPLDVLAQQLVAVAAGGPRTVDELYALCRGAAPFADLPRATFEAVLDLLAGRYPSDEIAALRPRVVWDRRRGTVRARAGAGRVAVANAGTIPDHGNYGVFLPGPGDGRGVRVGELDEEMVFESRVGDVFVLGASSWRITDITRDRVFVQPAPGEPGRMPFWHGDRPGRPAGFGRAVGQLTREVARATDGAARRRLALDHRLDPAAAASLIGYVREQQAATGEVPSDRAVVVERYQDEMGDWRVCLLSPFGRRVLGPWSLAVQARTRASTGAEPEAIVGDDGVVFRFPAADAPPPRELFFPTAAEAESLVRTHLPGTALFAAHFREVAARALLLPRRQVGRRAPLWHQRKRAADLLGVAARFPSFPMLLETMRECLHDVFDLPALREVLDGVAAGAVRVAVTTTRRPSPFAAALLYSYVGNFMYDEDEPPAERRARALAVDLSALRTLLGEAELRELLDPEVLAAHERRLQGLPAAGAPAAAAAAGAGAPAAVGPDDVHDLLLRLGDLDRDEIAARLGVAATAHLRALVAEERVVPVRLGRAARFVAVEDAGRYRDATGARLPAGLPPVFLEPAAAPVLDLVARYARTHGPFGAADVAARLGVGVAPVRQALEELRAAGRLIEGELRPGGSGLEFCDPEVLRAVKQQSLWRLRRAAAPVAPAALQEFLLEWHGLLEPARGPDALLQAVAQLEGAALPASILEREILPARVAGYRPGDLDALCAAGEVVWRGVERLGEHDGRVALHVRGRGADGDAPRQLGDALPDRSDAAREPPGETAAQVLEVLRRRGASFFADLRAALGGFTGDLNAALWELVWAGLVTNDTLLPLRALLHAGAAPPRAQARLLRHPAVRAHRTGPPGSEGRWSLVTPSAPEPATVRTLALVEQLLRRHGVLTREAVRAEGLAGGFAAVYPVLKALEEAGRLRRGYFVEHLGATQFALPGADEQLRLARDQVGASGGAGPGGIVTLAAADPASAYGAALPWPAHPVAHLLGRAAGAQVLLQRGHLRGFLTRTGHDLLLVARDAAAPARDDADVPAVAAALAALVDAGRRPHLLVARIDGEPASASRHAAAFRAAGFSTSSRGLLYRRRA